MEGIITPRIALIAVCHGLYFLVSGYVSGILLRNDVRIKLFLSIFITPIMVSTRRPAQYVEGPISASTKPMVIAVLLFLYIIGDGYTHLPLRSSTRRLFS